MLKPFTQETAMKPRRRSAKKERQHSLWSFSPSGAVAGKDLSLEAQGVDFSALKPMWVGGGKAVPAEKLPVIQRDAVALKQAVQARLGWYAGAVRRRALSNPADVAGYLALQEVDLLAAKQVPRHRLQALDAAVGFLIGAGEVKHG